MDRDEWIDCIKAHFKNLEKNGYTVRAGDALLGVEVRGYDVLSKRTYVAAVQDLEQKGLVEISATNNSRVWPTIRLTPNGARWTTT